MAAGDQIAVEIAQVDVSDYAILKQSWMLNDLRSFDKLDALWSPNRQGV